MQNGDLGVHLREELVVILEGVLCQVTTTHDVRRKLSIRRQRPVAFHINWHEIPMKRMVTIGERWPDYEVNIVTFLDQALADEAAEFLDLADIPHDSIAYQAFGTFTNTLRYRPRIRAIYDSDFDRLSSYGQVGIAVVRGEDF